MISIRKKIGRTPFALEVLIDAIRNHDNARYYARSVLNVLVLRGYYGQDEHEVSRNTNFALRSNLLFFLHGCSLALPLPSLLSLSSTVNYETEDEIENSEASIEISQGEIPVGTKLSGEIHAEVHPKDISLDDTNLCLSLSSVVRCFSFHYWVRSVSEFIFIADGEITFSFD